MGTFPGYWHLQNQSPLQSGSGLLNENERKEMTFLRQSHEMTPQTPFFVYLFASVFFCKMLQLNSFPVSGLRGLSNPDLWICRQESMAQVWMHIHLLLNSSQVLHWPMETVQLLTLRFASSIWSFSEFRRWYIDLFQVFLLHTLSVSVIWQVGVLALLSRVLGVFCSVLVY